MIHPIEKVMYSTGWTMVIVGLASSVCLLTGLSHGLDDEVIVKKLPMSLHTLYRSQGIYLSNGHVGGMCACALSGAQRFTGA